MEKPTKENMNRVKKMVAEHLEYTDSMVAKEIMDNWSKYRNKFKRVIPVMYKEITELKTDKVS